MGKPGVEPRHVASVPKVHQTREEQNLDQNDSLSDSTDNSLLHLTGSTQVQPFGVTMVVDNKPLRMEIDTGATSSLVAESSLARQGALASCASTAPMPKEEASHASMRRRGKKAHGEVNRSFDA